MSDTADLSGRVAVVTGANTGIGYEIARALAQRRACVVMACRDQEKARRAADMIRQEVDGASLHTEQLDLSDLAAVGSAAHRLRQTWPEVDLLINNAGVMAASLERTADGFEADFGTNFLGHFVLTAGLIDAVEQSRAGRVVTVSSVTHRSRNATVDPAAPETLPDPFDAASAYGRSKMAQMTFMLELQRRLTAAGSRTISVAAHPGGVRTNILQHQNPLVRLVYNPRLSWATGWFTQSPADGARPILHAAFEPEVRGGDFFGPRGRGELVGAPTSVRISSRAQDPESGRLLWEAAERLTGADFRIPTSPAGKG